jgi:hypothetical protein
MVGRVFLAPEDDRAAWFTSRGYEEER